ncbi:VOC family protein [Henriciella aquimarina]|uniref:VOC family protein n=1 Tax=Henriciella aquimarina TaxID=545261 RepID=UPI000A0278E8|nr:VOC family protein [Henriciella aquimarina]
MRLNQVTVPCVDYAASVDFYKQLGLVQIVDSPPRYARFECPSGDGGEPATFSLHHVEGWAGCDHPAVYFEVDDLDADYARLTEAGVTFLSAPQDQRWAWKEAWLRDPAGNRICLYQSGEMRRFPPWRIEPRETG